MTHNRFLPADHQAVSPLRSPHAPAGSAVDVVDAFALQFTSAANIVVVVGIATVDYGVARFQRRRK